MSNGAKQAAGGATYRMLRELGARAQHSYAAIREPHELVVAQRFARGPQRTNDGAHGLWVEATPLDTPAMALLLRDARCLAKNWHPNIGRVRYVDLVGAELTIASELIDGATLSDLFEAAASERTNARDPLLELSMLLRILLDVLAGLHALHSLRDGMNAPLHAIHGELCPANIVVGRDGVARIVNVLRPRPVRLLLGSEAVGYAAPEALDGEGTDDPRADVHAVGVILWEALAARRLYDEVDPARVLSMQREGELTTPAVHPSSPFARLGDAAMRALAFDPALRFQSANEMATELRKIAGSRLASGSAVAGRIVGLMGDSIRTRRATLDGTTSETLPATSRVVRTHPRVAAPTLEGELPVALIAASRESRPEDDADFEEDFELDEEELPGPRGSSPMLDPEAEAFALTSVAKPAVSPLTPNLPFPNDVADEKSDARRALAQGSSPRLLTSETLLAARARHPEPLAPSSERGNEPFFPAPTSSADARAAWPTLGPRPVRQPSLAETPGELVVPVGASELDQAAARGARRGRAGIVFAAAAAVVVLLTGASVAVRVRLGGTSAASTSVVPPPAVIETLPPAASTALDAAPAIAIAPAVPRASAATGASATPPARVTAPAAPPAVKPKRSVYDPDGI